MYSAKRHDVFQVSKMRAKETQTFVRELFAESTARHDDMGGVLSNACPQVSLSKTTFVFATLPSLFPDFVV